MLAIKTTVVVPWDFSEHAKCGLGFALEATSQNNIHVICVLDRPDPYTEGAIWGGEAEERAIEKCRAEFWEVVDNSRLGDLNFSVQFGDPAEEIVRFAESIPQSTIVMSTHGRSGIKRLMMGSVAQKVSQTASSPVMLLPNAWFESINQDDNAKVAFPIASLG